MRKLLMIGAAVALFAQLAALAAVPSLELSLEQNAIKVTDSSRALDGASGLYLVWDSADRGTDLNAWPAANRGKILVQSDGRFTFSEMADGNRRAFICTPEQKSNIREAFINLCTEL